MTPTAIVSSTKNPSPSVGPDTKTTSSFYMGSMVGVILAIIFGIGFFGMVAWWCINRERKYRRHIKATEGFYQQHKYKEMVSEVSSNSVYEMPSAAHFAREKEAGITHRRQELP